MKWHLTGIPNPKYKDRDRPSFIAPMLKEVTGHYKPEYADVVAHIGAISGIKECEADRLEAVRKNIHSTVWHLEKAAREDKHRFLFASSQAVNNPTNTYAITKQAAEGFCKLFANRLNLTIMRFSNVYGPGSGHKTSCIANWCRAGVKGENLVVNGTGAQTRDFIFIDDLCKQIQSLESGGELIENLCSGVQIPIIEAAKYIADKCNVKIEFHGEPEESPQGVTPMEGTITSLEDGIDATLEYFKTLSI